MIKLGLYNMYLVVDEKLKILSSTPVEKLDIFKNLWNS